MKPITRWGGGTVAVLLAVIAVGWPRVAPADDLYGSDRLLCAAVQATYCLEDGECGIDLPWNLNIPEFIEVDLEARRLSTTAASGENRATPIDHLNRVDGAIVFHGFEMGRAFSWVITEATGQLTAAVAAEGLAVSVFGACTPMDSDREGVTP